MDTILSDETVMSNASVTREGGTVTTSQKRASSQSKSNSRNTMKLTNQPPGHIYCREIADRLCFPGM